MSAPNADKYFLEGYRAFGPYDQQPKTPYQGWQGQQWENGWCVAARDYPFNAFPSEGK